MWADCCRLGGADVGISLSTPESNNRSSIYPFGRLQFDYRLDYLSAAALYHTSLPYVASLLPTCKSNLWIDGECGGPCCGAISKSLMHPPCCTNYPQVVIALPDHVRACMHACRWVTGSATFRGRGACLRDLGGQVRLLVEDQEGGHAQLAGPQQLHALLRASSVGHDNIVQCRGGRGHRHIVFAIDSTQITCTQSWCLFRALLNVSMCYICQHLLSRHRHHLALQAAGSPPSS